MLNGPSSPPPVIVTDALTPERPLLAPPGLLLAARQAPRASKLLVPGIGQEASGNRSLQGVNLHHCFIVTEIPWGADNPMGLG